MKHGIIGLTFAALLAATTGSGGRAHAAEDAAGQAAEQSGEQAQAKEAGWGDWARRGLYFGPSFGVGRSYRTDFAWSLNVNYRPWKFFGFQLGYFNLGSTKRGSGDFDGAYFGGSPILPLVAGVSLFGEGGYTVYSGDDAWAAGGGLLYDLPIDLVPFLTYGLTVRAGYRYMDFDRSAQMGTVGLMYRFGKVGDH